MNPNILPIERPWPSKLFVEVTTACNLRCAMCVKQSGPGIADDFLSEATFAGLIPAFSTLETLILNGIGEPLLHPGLEKFVRTARRHLPESASIGFQTNGTLLNDERACSLLDAGTNVISISVDAADPALFRSMREGGETDDVNRAADALEKAKKKVGANGFRWGAELVLSRDTLDELPGVIEWVAGRGGEFLLVTHILPYREEAAAAVAYDPNVDETLALFRRRRKEAAEQGLDLSEYYTAKWHLAPVKRREEIIVFMENVVAEISKQGLPQHIPNLVAYDEDRFVRMEKLFREVSEMHLAMKREISLLDFNDLENMACMLLADHPEAVAVLEDFDDMCSYIFVDEFQDTNIIQWKIIHKLAEEWLSGYGAKAEAGHSYGICLVGDRKQSIYRFRGAESGIFDIARE
ncbi:MAG: UvrD-helicase domain-containing protein, partial [Aminobacteriaceae bacterium]